MVCSDEKLTISLEDSFDKRRKDISKNLKKKLSCIDNIFIYSKLSNLCSDRFKPPDKFDQMTIDPIEFHFEPQQIEDNFKKSVEREVRQYTNDIYVNIDWSNISGNYMINGEILNRKYKRGITGYMNYQDAIKNQGAEYHEAVERDILEFWDAFKTGIKDFNGKYFIKNDSQPF